MTKPYRLALLVAVSFFIHFAVSSRFPLVEYKDGLLRISDFSHYVLATKAFWLQGLSPYNEADHTKMLSEVIGAPFGYTLIFALPPTALVLLLPYALVSSLSLELAHTAWVVTSLLILVLGVNAALRSGQTGSGRGALRAVLLLSVVMALSQTFVRTLYLGQMSILASGVLLLLYFMPTRDEDSRLVKILPVAGLILMSIKPVYFVIAVGVLLTQRKFKDVLLGITVLIVALLALSPMLSCSWPGEYNAALQTYFLDQEAEARTIYKGSIDIDTFVTFRTAFSSILGDLSALKVSKYFYLFTSLVILAWSFWMAIRPQSFSTSATQGESERSSAWALLLLSGSFLLFSPYLGSYEDLLTFPVMLVVASRANRLTGVNLCLIIAALALFIILNRPFVLAPQAMIVIFLLKLMIFSYLAGLLRVSSAARAEIH